MATSEIAYWLSPKSRITFIDSGSAPTIKVCDADGKAAYLHLNDGTLTDDASRRDAIAVLDALALAIVTAAKSLGVQPPVAAGPDDDDDDEPDGIAAHELVSVGADAKCDRCRHPHSLERIGDTLRTWCDECPCYVFVSPTAAIDPDDEPACRSCAARARTGSAGPIEAGCPECEAHRLRVGSARRAEAAGLANQAALARALYGSMADGEPAENELRAAHGDR